MTALDSTILDPLAYRVAAALGPNSYDANHAFSGVREALRFLGLDAGRFDTPAWNPLGAIVRPGDFVLIKPNLVREFRETHGHHADCTVTHGGVIRAVVDYVFKALDGRGRIVIADAPHSDANFDEVAKITGLREIQELYRRELGFEIEVYDLRPECADKVDGVIVGHRKLPGDPAGYTKVNLAQHSMFAEIEPLCHLLYGSEYDTNEIVSHHREGRHEFLISRSVLEADVVISVPKLKTHKKTGITVNMKNLVGINGNKNWLPHHREGTPSQGGDQFKDDAAGNKIERGVVAGFKRLFPLLGPLRPIIAGPIKAAGKRIFGDTNTNKIRSGNWYGNDTTWRMVIDLNRALHYFDADGKLHDQPVRRFFSIVDGIIGGEGNGPLDPLVKPAGLILAGRNPVLVDIAAARMMGFEWRKMSMLRRGVEKRVYTLANCGGTDVEIVSNNPAYCGQIDSITAPGLGFKPHFGWTGHLEWNGSKDETGAVA